MEAELLLLPRCLDLVGVEQERAHAPRAVGACVRASEHQERGCVTAVGDPLLRAVDHPAVAVGDGARPQRACVRAGVRLGERERAEDAPAREAGHEPLALLVRPERDDGQGDGARVDRHRDADTGIGPRQLLEHEHVGEEVRACAAELLGNAYPHQPELAELREQR